MLADGIPPPRTGHLPVTQHCDLNAAENGWRQQWLQVTIILHPTAGRLLHRHHLLGHGLRAAAIHNPVPVSSWVRRHHQLKPLPQAEDPTQEGDKAAAHIDRGAGVPPLGGRFCPASPGAVAGATAHGRRQSSPACCRPRSGSACQPTPCPPPNRPALSPAQATDWAVGLPDVRQTS